MDNATWLPYEQFAAEKKWFDALEQELIETAGLGYDKVPWINNENSRWLKEIRTEFRTPEIIIS